MKIFYRLPFLILTLSLSIVVTGCATYPLSGTMGNGKKFTGTINSDLLQGRSSIVAESLDNKTHCYGTSFITHLPTFSFGCEGQQGTAVLQCDDGRHVSANWYATSCTSGYGQGFDDHGGKFSFKFGNSH